MDNKAIVKILKGLASEEEKAGFFSKCESDPQFREEYIRLKNIWALSNDEEHQNKKLQFEKFWKIAKSTNSKNRINIVLKYSRLVAVLVVSFGITYLINYKLSNSAEKGLVQKFSSNIGSVSSVELDDGSVIWLNSGSKITFTEKSNSRITAKLVGEGYFNIVHNRKREFIVELNGLKIKDLGTKFNVKAYPLDQYMTATLLEGKIEMQNNQGQSFLEMNPNDHLFIDKTNNTYNLSTVDPNLVVSWKDGKFVFVDMSLREVCNELEKWYDVEINIQRKSIESEKYTSVIKRSTTIRNMLEMLKITAGIEYEIKTNENGKDLIIIN